jgi:hypothetical protein
MSWLTGNGAIAESPGRLSIRGCSTLVECGRVADLDHQGTHGAAFTGNARRGGAPNDTTFFHAIHYPQCIGPDLRPVFPSK